MYARIVIIGNPAAGGGTARKITRAYERIRKQGIEATLLLTTKSGDARAFARASAGPPNTLVIAAGGDGTYNEVANGLAGTATPMAILPLGTTSVLAREIGVSLDCDKALQQALRGDPLNVNLGTILQADSSRHFLLMAGMGFDAEAVHGVDEAVKRRSGRLAYVMSGFRTLLSYDPPELTVRAEATDEAGYAASPFRLHQPALMSRSGREIRMTGYAVIISNAACYGGCYKITPYASLSDPSLHVFVDHRPGRLSMARTLLAIVSGRTLSLDAISHFRAKEVTVEGDCHVQVDGDYQGSCPATFLTAPGALRLIVPADR